MAFWRVGTRRRRVCQEGGVVSWRWVIRGMGVVGGLGTEDGRRGIDGGGREEGEDRYLLLVMEADLTGRHAGVLVEVRPGCVDDCYVVLLVAYMPLSTLSLFLPIYKVPHNHRSRFYGSLPFRVWGTGVGFDCGYEKEGERQTFDRIRLRQLRAVIHQRCGQLIPFPALLQPQVDVCAGEVVGVELGFSCSISPPLAFY